jgi:energy-coupling factor transport system substrate-specific component
VTGVSRGSRLIGSTSPSPTFVLVFVALAAALNLVGGYAAGLVRLPIFLDTIGTAIAAIVLGPWWGALAGTLGNGAGSLAYGPTNIPFALVNVAVALVWGYGVRSLGLGRTPVRYFALNLLVVLVAACVATPIVLVLFGGATGHPSDVFTAALSRLGPQGAVFGDNLVVGLVDKVLTGYVALAMVQALPPHLLAGVELPTSGGGRWVAVATLGIGIALLLMLVILILQSTPVA